MAHVPGGPQASDAHPGGAPGAEALVDAGLRAWQDGDRLGAASAWHQALHAAEGQGDMRLVGAAQFNLAVLLADRGDADSARVGFDAAYAAWGDGVDRRWVAQALAAGGDRLHAAGELEPARRHLEAALALRRELGDRDAMAGLLDRLGEIARTRSGPAEARVWWEEAIGLHRRLRNGPALITTLVRLARLEIELERAREAQTWAIAAIEVPGTEIELRPAVDLLTELAGLAVDRADWPAARACATSAMSRPLSDPVARGDLAALLATVAWADHDAPLALRWGREALEPLRSHRDAALPALLHDLGILALEAGDIDAATTYLDEALALERDRDEGDR